MKRAIVFITLCLLIPCIALGEVTPQQIDSLSLADKTILEMIIRASLADKELGNDTEHRSSVLDIDLMELSVEELTWMSDYINTGTVPAPDNAPQPVYEKYNIEITVHDQPFRESKGLFGTVDYSFYRCIAGVCRQLICAEQNSNPEVQFNYDAQQLETARFYLTYYAYCNADTAKQAVEEYTDVCLEVLSASYPDLQMDNLFFCWSIPSIDADSFYAATFACRSIDGVLVRGEGNGLLYQ